MAEQSILGSPFFKLVKKRDGRLVPFEQDRITRAVLKAMAATGEGNEQDAYRVSDWTLKELMKKYPPGYILGIEEIQDMAETSLIILDYTKTAKAYIIYRQKRAEIRSQVREVPEKVRQLAAESKKYFRNALGEFIYYRSYSRWIEEEGRRETWIETVDRYIHFMKENVGGALTDEEYEELRQAILKQEAMPSMRLMWSAGEAAKKTNVAAYNCSFIAPTNLRDFSETMYLLMCGAGVGFTVEQHVVQKLPQIKHQTGEVLPTHVIEDSKEGWADALYLGLTAWFEGKDIAFDFSKLRPTGARLKTMGGKSSGPRPLMDLLEFSRRKILARQGRRLNPIDVHDIICKIGEIVVMGGVRRSALISLSDLDDTEMRLAKVGQFYLTEPQRSLANNSVAYSEKPTAAQFLEEWLALAKSGTGERGIFNRAGLKSQMPERRWQIFKKDSDTAGSNPCVPAEIWVMTNDGPYQVRDLIGKLFKALVNGGIYFSTGFFETGIKPIFEIRTDRGFTFKATENHKVLTVNYRTQKKQKNIWQEIKNLSVGDEIVLHNHQHIHWSGRGTEEEGWLLGNLFGDGNIEKSGKANLDYWGENRLVMMSQARALIHSTVSCRRDLVGHLAKSGYARVGSMGLGRLAFSYDLFHNNRKTIADTIEKTSSAFYSGFLRGWFDADGSVQGSQLKGVSIRLNSNSLSSLETAQRMLARLGIISAIYKNRRGAEYRFLPDGQGGVKQYFCQPNHELIISGVNIEIFAARINFSDSRKKEKLEKILRQYRRRLNKELFSAKITEIIPLGEETVYDCNVQDIHAFDGNGIYLHNCGEINLKSKEFCNLTEVVARAEDVEATLLNKIRLAAILGTYQSTLTKFPYLSDDWRKNCEEERLLGVSITGQWDCPAVRNKEVLKKIREKAIETNQIYAKRFGISPSLAITCVKPSGTVSQLVDAASGMHPRHSRYYIRRVRISATDSLFQMLKDQKVPYYPEVGQSIDAASTYVLEFPVKAPEGSVFKNDMSALEQLEYWKMVKENYTEHNPSVTISIGEDEWIEVANWVYGHWEMIGGLSFLPREDKDHIYPLAPYEEISEEKYNEMAANFPDVDFSQIILYEKEDETQGAKELACVGATCEIS